MRERRWKDESVMSKSDYLFGTRGRVREMD